MCDSVCSHLQAFGATGAMEGMNAIQQKNPLVALSEQVCLHLPAPASLLYCLHPPPPPLHCLSAAPSPCQCAVFCVNVKVETV